MKLAVIVISVIVVVALGVLLLRQGNPEETATHSDEAQNDTRSGRFHGGDDRPAGADVEDQSIGDRSVGGVSQPGADPDPPAGEPPRY